MNKTQKYRKVKQGLKNVLIAYAILGNIYGTSEYWSGMSNGHVSSDLYLGYSNPTKLEQLAINYFGKNDSNEK
jgi:hypothetical protein